MKNFYLNKMATWERLPVEVHQEVWRHLQPKEIFRLTLVCGRWRQLLLLDSVRATPNSLLFNKSIYNYLFICLILLQCELSIQNIYIY